MRVFYNTDSLPAFRNPVVTVGSYDGVHHGHRVILERVKQLAAETGGESVVVTFSPHPRQVLPRGGEVVLLSTLQEKIRLLSDTGIDNLVVLSFNSDFAALSSEEFVRGILVGKIGMKEFVVGYDHRFGHDQSGDFELLVQMGEKLGFGVEQIEKHLVDDEFKVSSTVLRNTVEEGNMALASQLLGRDYLMIADIRKGDEVVSGEGAKLLPPRGRYPVTVHIEGWPERRNVLKIDSERRARLEDAIGNENFTDVLITFNAN